MNEEKICVLLVRHLLFQDDFVPSSAKQQLEINVFSWLFSDNSIGDQLTGIKYNFKWFRYSKLSHLAYLIDRLIIIIKFDLIGLCTFRHLQEFSASTFVEGSVAQG